MSLLPPPDYMRECLKLADLKQGETYLEHIILEQSTIEAMIIKPYAPGISPKTPMWIYLIGIYDLTEEGKSNLLSWANDPENNFQTAYELGTQNYFESGMKNTNEEFYDIFGFEDDGLLCYGKFLDQYTVDNEYVGSIRFTHSQESFKNLKNK